MDVGPIDGDDAPRRRRVGLLIPIVALIGALTVSVVAVAWLAADTQDRQAIAALRHTLRSVVDSNLRELGGWVSDYAYWDAFVENVVVAPDLAWVDDNIGTYAHENLGIDVSLVIDGADGVYLKSLASENDLAETFEPLPADLAALARLARASPGLTDARPDPQVGLTRIGGHVFMMAASVAKWERRGDLPTREGGPVVLIYLREIDEPMLSGFGSDYMIAGLRLVGADSDDRATLALKAPDGRTVARLAWDSGLPGTQFLTDLSVPLAIILLIAGALMVFIVVRVRATVDQLLTAHEALNQRTVALRAARDEADLANRAKTEFLAQMSHDLRTPLNAILGFSEVIALQTFGSDAAAASRYRDYARQIHAGGDHLRTLIDSILDVARIDAGRYELRTEQVALDDLVATCLSLLQETFAAKSIAVDAPTSGLTVEADRGAIEQVLLNLMGNAAKYTDAGGSVSVTARSTGEGVSIAVADTGRGMSPADVEAAFDLFSRGGSALGAAAEGAGIGLSIVKRLVELHGGSVAIQSGLGVGTTVTFTLPNAPEAASRSNELVG